MKLLTVIMIGLAVGLSGCGKKKNDKNNVKKKGDPPAGKATKATAKLGYKIEKEGENYKITLNDKFAEANKKTAKSDTCDVTKNYDAVKGEQNALDIKLENKVLTITGNGNKEVLKGTAKDKETTMDGTYDAGKGLTFTLSKAEGADGELNLIMTCAAKKK